MLLFKNIKTVTLKEVGKTLEGGGYGYGIMGVIVSDVCIYHQTHWVVYIKYVHVFYISTMP